MFSHASKVTLVEQAVDHGYLVYLHVIVVPAELSVQRVTERVRRGGHTVPERKIRERFDRLWPLVAAARRVADRTEIYDNSAAATPFRYIASYERGALVAAADWPKWAPDALR